MEMINEEELEVPPGFTHPNQDINATTGVDAEAAFFSGCKSGIIEPNSVSAQHSTGCMHRCLSSANYNCVMKRKRKFSDNVTRRFPVPRRPRAAEARRSRFYHPEMHTGSHNKVFSSQSPQVQEPCSIPFVQIAAECPNSQTNNQLCDQSSEINISPSSDHRPRRSTTTSMKGTAHGIAIDNNQRSDSHKSYFNANDGEEMVIGTSSTKLLFPASGHRRKQRAGQNNHPSQRIDPDILKHLKNVLQDVPSSDETRVKTRSSDTKKPGDVKPPIQAGLHSQFYMCSSMH